MYPLKKHFDIEIVIVKMFFFLLIWLSQREFSRAQYIFENCMTKVIGQKTVGTGEGNYWSLNTVWSMCQIRNKIIDSLSVKGSAKISTFAFINGTNSITKHQVWFIFIGFYILYVLCFIQSFVFALGLFLCLFCHLKCLEVITIDFLIYWLSLTDFLEDSRTGHL